jgi:hypothetical protein
MRKSLLFLGRVLCLLAALMHGAYACEAPKPVGSTLQVAWISPVNQRVGAKGMLTVVRTLDLRALVVAKNRDLSAVLKALGMLRPKAEARKAYKITLFDVKADWLCRPLVLETEPEEGAEAPVVGGVRVCGGRWQTAHPGILRKSWTDCGYLLDRVDGKRTLDVFRLDWRTAVTWGFCVMPLERFIEGA